MWPVVTARASSPTRPGARDAGAGVVVVSPLGRSMSPSRPPEQKALAKALLSAPEVDLILGTHVHVVQPCERSMAM